MANFVNANVRRPKCQCGKVSFDKKTAQTQAHWLEKRGKEHALRIYQCPLSDVWHLTKVDKYRK